MKKDEVSPPTIFKTLNLVTADWLDWFPLDDYANPLPSSGT